MLSIIGFAQASSDKHIANLRLGMSKGAALEALSEYTKMPMNRLLVTKVDEGNIYHPNSYKYFHPHYHFELLVGFSDNDELVRVQRSQIDRCVHLTTNFRTGATYIHPNYLPFGSGLFAQNRAALEPYMTQQGNQLCFSFSKYTPEQMYDLFGLELSRSQTMILMQPEKYNFKALSNMTVYVNDVDVHNEAIHGIQLTMTMDDAIAAVTKQLALSDEQIKIGHLDHNPITGKKEPKFFEVMVPKTDQKIRVDLYPNPEIHPTQLFVGKVTLNQFTTDEALEKYGVPTETVQNAKRDDAEKNHTLKWCQNECDQKLDAVLRLEATQSGEHLVLSNEKYAELSSYKKRFGEMPKALVEYIQQYQYQPANTDQFDIGGVKIGMTLSEAIAAAEAYYPKPFVRIVYGKEYNPYTDEKEQMNAYITLTADGQKRQLLSINALPDVEGNPENLIVYKVRLQDDFRETYSDALDEKYGRPTRIIDNDAIWCKDPVVTEFYPCEGKKDTVLHHMSRANDFLKLENLVIKEKFDAMKKQIRLEAQKAKAENKAAAF